MESMNLPSRPVVTSQLAAEAIVNQWSRENERQKITDGDGLDWRLECEIDQEIIEPLQKKEIWKVSLRLICDASSEDLVKTGALDSEKDERIIDLLGDSRVPLSLKPRVFQAKSIEEAKNLSLETLDRLEKEMAKASLLEAKRRLIFRFVDQSSLFGSPSERL